MTSLQTTRTSLKNWFPILKHVILGANGVEVIDEGELYPLFPMHIWNLRERTLQNQPRTNNNLEGYHFALQCVVSGVHPNIWKLILALKKVQFDGGHGIPEKRKYKDLNERLKNIVLRYDSQKKKNRFPESCCKDFTLLKLVFLLF